MKNQSKKILFRLLLPVFVIGLFSLSVILLYNQNNILAQEGSIQCSPQIPIGEALERSGELSYDLYREISALDFEIEKQIQKAEEMIEGAGQCNISSCNSVDCGIQQECDPPTPIYDSAGQQVGSDPGACYEACGPSQACTGRSGNNPCPQTDIEASFQTISSSYNSVLASKKKIVALIDGQDENVVEKVAICSKENEDIWLGLEKLTCASSPCKQNPSASGCPMLPKTALIARKLDRAREGFDSCSVSPADWGKIESGQVASKSVLDCQTVVEREYDRQQPDCRCAPGISPLPPECNDVNKKSLLNYYCCR